MEITSEQLKALNNITGINLKKLKTYFGYFNPPYDKNPRKEYLYNVIRCGSSSVNKLKKFTFFIDNIKCRHAKDIIIHNNIRFGHIRPDLFPETNDTVIGVTET